MGRYSTVKGRNGEKEVQRFFKEHGYNLERGGTRSYGERPDLFGLPFIHLEVKRCERVEMPKWLAQARRDALRFKDGCPVVIHRRSNEDWFATMPLSAWIKLYDAYSKERDINEDNNN